MWEPTPDWMAQAACRNVKPDLFFPERGVDCGDAKRVCFGCPVRAECLQYALDNGMRYGIWGGTSERDRRRMRMTHLRVAS